MLNVPERSLEPEPDMNTIVYDIVRSITGVRKITMDKEGMTLWFSRKRYPHITRNRYEIVRNTLQKRGLQLYIIAINSSRGLGVRICF